MNIILDFCGTCGTLLEEGQGLEKEPKCSNCGGGLRDRSARAQGVFSDIDAERLHQALFPKGG